MEEYDVDADLALVYADSWKRLTQLQPSEFGTTDEIEEQRRAYRMFRAARVMSMIGMTALPPRRLGHRTTQLEKAALGAASYPLTSMVLRHSCISDGIEAEERGSCSGSSSQAIGRAAKRQRQRDRRKMYRAC